MQYLLMIYENEQTWNDIPPPEKQKLFGEYFALTESLKKDGRYLGGNPLEPVRSATTVRVRDGKNVTTDGPFAETKEQLGGYFLVDAKDLDDALDIAARIPGARVGSIEVRPIMKFE